MLAVGGTKGAMALLSWARWLILLWSHLSLAQMIAPSDDMGDLAPAGTGRWALNTTASVGTAPLRLYPLSTYLEGMSYDEFQSFQVNGSLLRVNPDTIVDIQSDTIAYIDCEDSAYPGELKASNTFNLASINNPQPSAIILYSTTRSHCNYITVEGAEFQNTFTTVDPMSAALIASRNLSMADTLVYADLQAARHDASSGNSSTTSSSGSKVNGPAPSTATTMIILYAITGIITALFVTIIVTGAVRAHRHPERYGPRNIAGRPRQSRTKGIARAILETLPIVKFGDTSAEQRQPKNDVELGTASNRGTTELSNETGAAESTEIALADNASIAGETRSHHSDSTTSSRPDGTDEHGSLGCSICTEEFAKGVEVRVLPCNHKFHPDCVDPWLLNVSGTCPLCRVNLDPNSADENPESESVDDRSGNHLAPPVASDGGTRRRPLSVILIDRLHSRRISMLTPEERLATARRFNEEGNSTGERPRLSERLREHLHIRTRRQGDDSQGNTPRSATPVEVSGGIGGAETSQREAGEPSTARTS